MHELRRTGTRGAWPGVSIVDMREELREGNRDIFSRPLRSELARCLSVGDQAILFLNRRGRSSFVQLPHLRRRSAVPPL